GLQYIHKRLIHTIFTLEKEKINLEKTTIQLRNEIEARRNSELQVINSEKNFRNIFEQSSDAILIVDLNKRILDFNDELKNLTGLNEKQIFEKDVMHFLPRKIRKDYKNFFNEPEQVPTRFDLKFEALHGKTRYIDCSTSLIRYNGEKAFLFMIRDLTERINLEKANFLISVAAEERERSRFSKELHDGLGPLLSTLKIYLEMFYSNPGDEETKKRINSTLTDSIKTVKEISNNLSPYVLENMGLNKAIESFIDKVKFSQKITVNFRSNFKGRVSQEIEISIFRIITELINNTLKYANAHNIEISLNKNNLIISLQYNDDGIGFDYDKIIEQKKGIGLFNLKSRIENFGGEITIFTSPGKGFKMNAYLNIT
ncbi:MAG: PAS domain S-box protein, partial [Prolixibacteraceae bacterium]|nr:PAS domain S-box protein [Prolixibacteraceae bacterium]